jgi:hypothetical protein
MEPVAPFGEILDAASKLPLDDQQALADILHRRVIEQRRTEMADELRQSKREFESGVCPPVSPDEIMKEILS